MKYSYFKSVARWACKKMKADDRVLEILTERFREGHKSHTRLYRKDWIDNPNLDDSDRDNWKSKIEMYSWSFETSDFKPAKQSTADILVFRYKKYKGQKKCDCRIIHKLQSGKIK